MKNDLSVDPGDEVPGADSGSRGRSVFLDGADFNPYSLVASVGHDPGQVGAIVADVVSNRQRKAPSLGKHYVFDPFVYYELHSDPLISNHLDWAKKSL